MPEELPLISVIMPTRNRATMTLRAIESVLNQDYPRIEVLVVDDASTDDTWQQLQRHHGSDSRVRLFRQIERSGACAARNRAIEAAHGELITDIDDDDEFLPGRLSALQAALDDRYSAVGSGYLWNYGASSRALYTSREVVELPALLDMNRLSHLLCRTEHLHALDGFDEKLAAFQDYDLWVRLVASHGPALRIATPLYRVNAGHGEGRISDAERRLAAHRQLVAKHRPLMSERNLRNQAFYRATQGDEPLGFVALLKSLPDGLVAMKGRYALSRLMKGTGRLRLRYLKSGVAGLFGR